MPLHVRRGTPEGPLHVRRGTPERALHVRGGPPQGCCCNPIYQAIYHMYRPMQIAHKVWFIIAQVKYVYSDMIWYNTIQWNIT